VPKAVQFDEHGEVDVLKVVEVARPSPGPGEVLVRVRAAGINPGEAKIRRGVMHERFPATFPSGQGSDLAGVVEEVGPGVTGLAAGDPVLGFNWSRASQAEYVVTPADRLVRKPDGVAWEVAGALFVAGSTAYAAVRAVDPEPGETVAVSSAAGGVGSLAVQLAARTGARVLGIAGTDHHPWLRAHGIEPIAYGEGLEERLREATGGTLDAFIDTYGGGYVELAIQLGVPPGRINTIADFVAVDEFGVKADGSATAATQDVLAELSRLVAQGDLEVPVRATYPLEEVQAAFRDLEQGHGLGKIVLTMPG
jgi:NADPH:quinone reductase-like Zn-dependent oxidoreductase